MNAKLSWGFLVSGVIIAVIAGLVIEWVNRAVLAPTCSPAVAAARQGLTGKNAYAYGAATKACTGKAASRNAQGSFFGPSDQNRPAWDYAPARAGHGFRRR